MACQNSQNRQSRNPDPLAQQANALREAEDAKRLQRRH
jgi:hypothetical protein